MLCRLQVSEPLLQLNSIMSFKLWHQAGARQHFQLHIEKKGNQPLQIRILAVHLSLPVSAFCTWHNPGTILRRTQQQASMAI